MPRCSECQHELPSALAFCPACGSALDLDVVPPPPPSVSESEPGEVDERTLSLGDDLPLPEEEIAAPPPTPPAAAMASDPVQELPDPLWVPEEPPDTSTSGLAQWGFICAFIIPPLGFLLSLFGLVTIQEPRQGRGLAIAGLIIAIIRIRRG